MRIVRQVALFAALSGVAGCSGDAAGPSYEDVSGTYAGVMSGLSQGVLLTGTFSITLNQSAGTLSGSYSIAGTLDDGVFQVDIIGSGSINGTIGSGANPSINVTLRPGSCPLYSVTFSGTYDSSNRRINVLGPVDILDQNCTVVLRYTMNILLLR